MPEGNEGEHRPVRQFALINSVQLGYALQIYSGGSTTFKFKFKPADCAYKNFGSNVSGRARPQPTSSGVKSNLERYLFIVKYVNDARLNTACSLSSSRKIFLFLGSCRLLSLKYWFRSFTTSPRDAFWTLRTSANCGCSINCFENTELRFSPVFFVFSFFPAGAVLGKCLERYFAIVVSVIESTPTRFFSASSHSILFLFLASNSPFEVA
mmetsp:Transcript_20071/g.34544  ORF Transcript_20071/g.34544 Transcript_20071/m.34544 type:complete len:210 (-) Transcript_20071:639-1268(-)